MTNHFVNSTTVTNFDKNVEVDQREYDGLFNLWERQLSLESNPEEVTWAWTVIGVYNSEKEATQARETRRKEISNFS